MLLDGNVINRWLESTVAKISLIFVLCVCMFNVRLSYGEVTFVLQSTGETHSMAPGSGMEVVLFAQGVYCTKK